MPQKRSFITDSVETLAAKTIGIIQTLNDECEATSLRKRVANVVGLGKDDQILRGTMISILRDVRTQERFETVSTAWTKAQTAWSEWVAAENAKKHNGAMAINRAYFPAFVELEARVEAIKDGNVGDGDLVADLKAVAAEITQEFYQANWCKCGEPLYIITPKDLGKKPFMPKDCNKCHNETPEAEQTTKRKIKKPGSAAKRGQNRGSKSRAKAEDGGKKRAVKAAKATRHGEGK